MQALALVHSADHVCCRYRLAAFRASLAEHGLTLRIAPLERNTLRRVRQLRTVGGAGVVILQRKLLPLWQLSILRRAAGRLVFDLDDAVFQRDSYSRRPPESAQRLLRFWATVYAADAVIAGNDDLAERAAAYVGPDRVHVIPTCVEPRPYQAATHHRRSAVRLVWIGQRSTVPSLEHAGAHLAAAARRVPGLELHVISDVFPKMSSLPCIERPWSPETETDELADCDVGVSWLPDDAWSRGKCGLKVLQYMAAGLPVVANPVGVQRKLIVDGLTGILASTPREWSEAIARLAASPGLRQRMGRAGRRRVEEHYSVSHVGPRFARLIASAAGRGVLRRSAASYGPLVRAARAAL